MGKVNSVALIAILLAACAASTLAAGYFRGQYLHMSLRMPDYHQRAEIIANKDATIRKLEQVIATQRELLARCEGGY